MLRLVARSIDQSGIQPSYESIASAMGYASKGYIYAMVVSLRSKGILRKPKRGELGFAFNWREYL
jgi:SOS-response transcriptional repressor LexA